MIEIAVFCMALNVFHEARGESFDGQQAVALVTWNRAGKRKDKVCEVVTKDRQFSWTADKLQLTSKGYRLKKGAYPKKQEKAAWRSAVFVAELVMKNKVPDFTHGSTHYHANYVRPQWAKSMKLTRVVGRHIFYRIA